MLFRHSVGNHQGNELTRNSSGNVPPLSSQLAVTCHLHFWQNDRDLLRASAVKQRVERTSNNNQHRKFTLEKKILPPLLPGFEFETFRSRVWRSTSKLSRLPTRQTIASLVSGIWANRLALPVRGLSFLVPLCSLHGMIEWFVGYSSVFLTSVTQLPDLEMVVVDWWRMEGIPGQKPTG